MKLVIWTNMPTHHQTAFFQALRARNMDVLIGYYSCVDERRKSMGWLDHSLEDYELSVGSVSDLENKIVDWKDRIHILSGIIDPFNRRLVLHLIKHKVKWIHWSEGFKWRLKTFLLLPIHVTYSKVIVNRFALGLFAIGSHAYRQFSAWGVKKHKIVNMPYSVAPLLNSGEKEPKFTFLYLGSIENRKAVDSLIQAFCIFSKDSDSYLKIVGRIAKGKAEKPLEYYQQLAQSGGANERISFHPAVPADCISKEISKAQVLVLPSKFDGWGVVVNEAISLNKFVILSDMVGAADTLVDNGVNGLIFNVNDIFGLSECLRASKSLVKDQSRMTHTRSLFYRVSPEENAARLEMAINSFLLFS